MIFVYGFPLLMICAPLLFFGLWVWWTRTPGLAQLAMATVAVLAGFLAHAWIVEPAAGSTGFALGWGQGGFWLLWLLFAMPALNRATQSLPVLPKTASLRPRQLELPPFAFVWPWFVWAGLVALVQARADGNWIAYLGPVLGALGLAFLQPCLRLGLLEPEPLGDADPAALAVRYAAFRRNRVRGMYALSVTLSLLVTAGWLVPFVGRLGGAWGGIVGSLLGVIGGVFGTWASAQRYLLRRQAAGLSI